jgi:hypothetical protein
VSATCHDALARIAALDLGGWDGLPACSLAEVEAAWRAGGAAQELRLGSEASTAQPFDLGARWARVWSRDGVVALVDVEDAPGVDVAALGEPEARLTAHSGFAAYPEGELVFAGRGLAVGVSPSGAVLYVAFFAPATVEEYARALRVDRAQRPLPQGGAL